MIVNKRCFCKKRVPLHNRVPPANKVKLKHALYFVKNLNNMSLIPKTISTPNYLLTCMGGGLFYTQHSHYIFTMIDCIHSIHSHLVHPSYVHSNNAWNKFILFYSRYHLSASMKDVPSLTRPHQASQHISAINMSQHLPCLKHSLWRCSTPQSRT